MDCGLTSHRYNLNPPLAPPLGSPHHQEHEPKPDLYARVFALRFQWPPIAKSIATGLLLIALPFLLFWQTWWPSSHHRHVFANGDFVEQHYPFRVFVARELRAGQLPLWDAHTFGGYPAIAESLHATFYPLGLWQILFDEYLPFMALEIEALFHLGLAGVFTFLLVRQLTGRGDAGLLAGVAFSLSGLLTSYPLLQLTILEAAVWLPASIWLLELALQRHSLRLAAIAGVALGCSLLAGHPQTSLYIALVVGGYILTRVISHLDECVFVMVTALLACGIALGLSAAQWLPSIELAAVSTRSQLPYEQLSGGFGLSALWGLLRPNPGEWSPLYVGIVPLCLAIVGLSISRVEVRFWAITATVALLLSLGRHGLLYPLLYSLVPGAALFRGQERAALVVIFAMIILAGYGFSSLTRQKWMPRWALPVLLALTMIDLFRANYGIILEQHPPGGYFAPTPAADFLNQNNGDWRVSSEGLLPGGGNAGKFFQFRDVTGNGPLSIAHYHRFLEKVPEVRWWQLLNVRFALTPRVIDYPGVHLVLEDRQRDERLYRINLGGQPAWITHAFEMAPSQEAAFQMTAAMEWLDPLTTTVLETQPNPAPEPETGPEIVRVISYDNQHIEAVIRLSSPAIVMFSEIDYPGWQARANGQPIETVRAFGLLRALALPAGIWDVQWNYHPDPVSDGIALSGLTILIVSFLVIRDPKWDVNIHTHQST